MCETKLVITTIILNSRPFCLPKLEILFALPNIV